MDQLMAEHMVVVRIDAAERHDDAAACRLGHAPHLLWYEAADDIGLLEIGRTLVKNDRFMVEREMENFDYRPCHRSSICAAVLARFFILP